MTYPGAGHYFVTPGIPTTDSDKLAFDSGFTMLLGGNPHANAVAHAKAWKSVKSFLGKFLS
uniref:acyl-CoA thioester hydrolase/BAAT C-terminal domain-containing protein n=1 Tax=Oceanobacillus sp. FSL W7-1293 TaxID=2921699 RepID=UPI00403F8394